MTRVNVVVDLGGTRVRTAAADPSLRLLGRTDEPTIHARGPEGVIEQIARMTGRSLETSGADWSAVGILVVAAPGPLNTTTGTVFSPPNMLGWGDVLVGPRLSSRSGVPVKVGNDANAAGVGEYEFGAGRDVQNMVYITVSTGIGGGVVANGRLIEAGPPGLRRRWSPRDVRAGGPTRRGLWRASVVGSGRCG